jgi:hypothetical protein
MRKDRKLETDCWYDVDAKVNNGEKLFGVRENVKQFEQVVNEAHFLFDFELRGLKFNDAKVLFFIKPDYGLKLPEIMQWIKQTFAVRFNRDHGRTGHVWTDRYGSRIVDSEPPEWAEGYRFLPIVRPVKRGDWERDAAARGFRRRAGNADAAGRNPATEGRPLLNPCSGARRAVVIQQHPQRFAAKSGILALGETGFASSAGTNPACLPVVRRGCCRWRLSRRMR